jgi:hypothetical protein
MSTKKTTQRPSVPVLPSRKRFSWNPRNPLKYEQLPKEIKDSVDRHVADELQTIYSDYERLLKLETSMTSKQITVDDITDTLDRMSAEDQNVAMKQIIESVKVFKMERVHILSVQLKEVEEARKAALESEDQFKLLLK